MTMSHQTIAAAPDRRVGLSWPLLVGAATFLLLLTRRELLNDGDTYAHVAAGRWMFEHLAIPNVDPFSHTLRGAPWIAHEWLSEIVYASAYAAGGWSAVVATAATAFAMALAILTRYLLRHLEPIYALLFVALAGGMAAPHLLARPHTLAAPLLVFWGVALLRAREKCRAPSFWLAPLMTLWANLHGSFPLGLGFAAAFAAEAFFETNDATARRRVIRQWSIFLSAALLASLLTPHGIHGLTFVAELHGNTYALDGIDEWQSPNFHHLQELEVWLLIAIAAMLTRGLRLPPVRIALLLGLLHLALRYQRHVDLLGFLTPLLVAQPFAAQWFAGAGMRPHATGLDRFFATLAKPAGKMACGITLTVLATASLVVIHRDILRPASNISPEAAVQAVHAAFPGGASTFPGPVLNAYEFGGYLIFVGVPPFVDGRADLYGDAFLTRFNRALNLGDTDLLPQLLDRYHAGWTLLPPGMPAVALLDRLPGWHRLYADETAVVHIRTEQK
jgi:hypothetical protein